MDPHANRPGPSRSQQAIHALNSALRNTYQYSSHYAQAYYSQQQNSALMTTPEGYSISSTYVNSPSTQIPQQSIGAGPSHRGRGRPHTRSGAGRGSAFGRPQQQQSHWYEPGNERCTYEQCAFTGSKKSVEIHMMDRHLIYPPGWENLKRKPEWDADPSLNNGKPIPIQGTSVILDTPEAVADWIAERKKRFPTKSRIEEKEKKLQEAVERGEIFVTDPTLRGRKRPNPDDRSNPRGQPGKRGRGASRPQVPTVVHPLPQKPVAAPLVPSSYGDIDSGSGSDMDPEKDAVPSKPPPEAMEIIAPEKPEAEEKEAREEVTNKDLIKPILRKPAPRPKALPSNPFSNRPSFLRNLLLPEIRMTVSNFSQAIHFLVENDFLDGVELKPGEIDENPIQIISETTNETPP